MRVELENSKSNTEIFDDFIKPGKEMITAIEAGEINQLTKLKGIGRRTAQKIIATLGGKMGKFALIRSEDRPVEPPVEDFSKQVLDVMIKQLGHRMTDAGR